MDEAKSARDRKKEATKFLSDLNSGFFDAFGELTAAGKQAKQNVETQQKWDKRKEDREEKRWKDELASLRKQKITDKKDQEKHDKKILALQEKHEKKLLAMKGKSVGGQKVNAKRESIQSESERRLAAKAAALSQSTDEKIASSSSTLSRIFEQDQVHHAHRSMMSTILNLAQAKQAIRQHKDFKAGQLLFEGMRHMAHQNWVATTGVQKELVRIHSVLVKDTPGANGQQGQRLARMSDERAELLKREARLDAKVGSLSGETGIYGLGRHKEFSTMTELNTEIAKGNKNALEIEKEMIAFRKKTALEARENVKWEKDPEWDGKDRKNRWKLDKDKNRIQKYALINKSAHIPDRILPPETDGLAGLGGADGGIVEAIKQHAMTVNEQSNKRVLRNRHATEKWTTNFWEKVWEKPDAKSFLIGNVKTQYGMKGDLTKDDGTTSKLISKITKINSDQFKQMQGDPAIAKEFAKENKIDPDKFVKGLEDGSVYMTATGNIRSKKDIKLQTKVNEMLSTKGSAYTHDTHVEKKLEELVTLFRGEGRNHVSARAMGDKDRSDPGMRWWAEDEGHAARFGKVKSKQVDMANKKMFNITPIANMEQGFGDLLNPDKHKDIESLNHTSNTAKMFQELLGLDEKNEDGKLHSSQRGQHLLYGEGGDTVIKYLKELGYDGLSLGGQFGDTHAFFPEESEDLLKQIADNTGKEVDISDAGRKLDIKQDRANREKKQDSFGMGDGAKNLLGKTNTGSKLTNMLGGATSLLDKALLVGGGSGATVTGAMLWKRLKKMMKKPKFLTKMGTWLAKRFGAAGIIAMFSGPVGWLLGALAIGYSIYSLWEMLDEMEKEINEEIAAEGEAEAAATPKNANITAALLTPYVGNMSNQVASLGRGRGFGMFGQGFGPGGTGGPGGRGIMSSTGGGRAKGAFPPLPAGRITIAHRGNLSREEYKTLRAQVDSRNGINQPGITSADRVARRSAARNDMWKSLHEHPKNFKPISRTPKNSPNKDLQHKFNQDKNIMTDKEFENYYGFPKNGGMSSLGMLNNIAYNNLSGQSGGSGGGGNLSIDNSNNNVITTNSSTVISATTAHAPSTPAGMNFSMV
jgi:hypothetical protein